MQDRPGWDGMGLFPAVSFSSPQKSPLWRTWWAQGRPRGLCLVPGWVSPFPSLSFGREKAQTLFTCLMVEPWLSAGTGWVFWARGTGRHLARGSSLARLFISRIAEREREDAGSAGMHREDAGSTFTLGQDPHPCPVPAEQSGTGA